MVVCVSIPKPEFLENLQLLPFHGATPFLQIEGIWLYGMGRRAQLLPYDFPLPTRMDPTFTLKSSCLKVRNIWAGTRFAGEIFTFPRLCLWSSTLSYSQTNRRQENFRRIFLANPSFSYGAGPYRMRRVIDWSNEDDLGGQMPRSPLLKMESWSVIGHCLASLVIAF